jgi:hypothetical protein
LRLRLEDLVRSGRWRDGQDGSGRHSCGRVVIGAESSQDIDANVVATIPPIWRTMCSGPINAAVGPASISGADDRNCGSGWARALWIGSPALWNGLLSGRINWLFMGIITTPARLCIPTALDWHRAAADEA